MPCPVSATSIRAHAPSRPGPDFERAAAVHGVARVQEQVQEHLLQLAGIAVDRREAPIEFQLGLDLMPPSPTGAPAARASPESRCSV